MWLHDLLFKAHDDFNVLVLHGQECTCVKHSVEVVHLLDWPPFYNCLALDFKCRLVLHIINNVLDQNWAEIFVNICETFLRFKKVDTQPKTERGWLACTLLLR